MLAPQLTSPALRARRPRYLRLLALSALVGGLAGGLAGCSFTPQVLSTNGAAAYVRANNEANGTGRSGRLTLTGVGIGLSLGAYGGVDVTRLQGTIDGVEVEGQPDNINDITARLTDVALRIGAPIRTRRPNVALNPSVAWIHRTTSFVEGQSETAFIVRPSVGVAVSFGLFAITPHVGYDVPVYSQEMGSGISSGMGGFSGGVTLSFDCGCIGM